jgi:hypothetical protein
MGVSSSNAVKIFYCYAHEDQNLRDELEKQLNPLKRISLITEWFDQKIEAGADWLFEIEKHFDASHVVLLLLSPDFCFSNHCYDLMKKALESHKAGKIRAIPILLRPSLMWDVLPISELQPLPHNTIAVTGWNNRVVDLGGGTGLSTTSGLSKPNT